MRRTLIVLAGVALGLWLSRQSNASELQVAIVQGPNIRTFTGAAGGKYSVQCPSVDGGAGQQVWYRPGCPTRADAGVQCVVDAGQGDVILDFSSNTDPYKIDLAVNEDRIHLGTAPGTGTAYSALYCLIYRRSP